MTETIESLVHVERHNQNNYAAGIVEIRSYEFVSFNVGKFRGAVRPKAELLWTIEID